MLRAIGVIGLVVCGCSATPPGDATGQDFQLELAIGGIGSAADTVTSGGVSTPVAAGDADLFIVFPAYSDALAAGDQSVSFLRNGQVVTTGVIRAGACTGCVYSGCPSQATITLERQEYSGTDVAPGAYLCFTCAGGDKLEKACE